MSETRRTPEAMEAHDNLRSRIDQLERALTTERERADRAKAEGIKEGMRRAAEIAEQHASVKGIAQRIRDAILKEAGE